MSQASTETPADALSTLQGSGNSETTKESHPSTTGVTVEAVDSSRGATNRVEKSTAKDDQEKPNEDEEKKDETTEKMEKKAIKKRDPQMAKAVSELVKNLGVWKKSFPQSILDDIENLEKLAGVSTKEKPNDYAIKVERGTMEDWIQVLFKTPKDPRPVLQAYYRSAAVLSSRNSDGHAKSVRRTVKLEDDYSKQITSDSKDLQRIKINSTLLVTELESIASIKFNLNPVVMAPPYKYIIEFLPAMKTRLSTLKQDLEDLPVPKADAIEAKGDTESEVGDSDKDTSHRATDSKETSEEQLKDRISHLELLLKFSEEELKEVFDLRASIRNGSLDRIAFEDLWYLFKPGDLVYSEMNGRVQLYKVFSVTGGQISRSSAENHDVHCIHSMGANRGYPPPPPGDYEEEDFDMEMREAASGVGTYTPFKLDCYIFDFDGIKYGAVDVVLKMKYYSGKRDISKLKVYPIEFHPEKERVLKELEERGRKYLASGGHKSYDGMTVALRRSAARYELDSDVYVDSEAYYQLFPAKKPRLGQLLKSKTDRTEIVESLGRQSAWELSDHEVDARLAEEFLAKNRSTVESLDASEIINTPENLRLLPSYVIGYAFRARAWYSLDIDLIADIEKVSSNPQKSGFDDLVISSKHRKLLVALVENHVSGLERKRRKAEGAALDHSPTQIDLVRNKGQGLIILLHGPPGSGKTSTAETIAAYTGRPLYSITCGDIGLLPTDVEINLKMHTRQADKWGCVLLLDEADVFLMQRNWQNVKRNALVSVFLRQLEYYSGILFLTTNRPGVIDEAFKSRIHISLRYPAVDQEMTRQIWTNLLNRIERDNENSDVKVVFDKTDLLEYAEKHYRRNDAKGMAWNGRQIRNAFQTALAMTYYERTAKLRKRGMSITDAAASGKSKYMTVELNRSHFKKIAETTREFEEYIDALRGKDADRAKEDRLRDDDYDVQDHSGSSWAQKPYPKPTAARTSNHAKRIGRDFPEQRTREGSRVQHRKAAQEESSSDEDGMEKADSSSEVLSDSED